jgi:catalase
VASSARAEGRRFPWLRAALALVALLAVLAVVIVGIWARLPVLLAVPLAALAGWLVASVLYLMKPMVYGRALGILATAAAAIVLLAPGRWRWVAAVPVGGAAILVWLRWRGERSVDAVPRDRTLVPFSFDDGDRLVDTLDAVWGSTRDGGCRHGLRAAHSHGTRVTGTWERDATCEKPPADVPLFDHHQTGTVVARFSNFSGEIRRDDTRRVPHGLALALQAPGQASFVMVLVDIRRFPVATKEDFVTFTNCARARGLRKAGGFANLILSARMPIPATLGFMLRRRVNSYADRTYHGLNTFCCKLDGNDVPVRYRVVPETDRAGAVSPETVAVPRTRLDSELQARLRSGRPLRFVVELVLGRRNGKNLSTDRVRDPTRRWWWTETRRLCKITLDRFVPPEEPDRWLFHPFDVPPGIRPSDDEILSARGTAYATSYLRRCPLEEVSP